MNSRIPGTSWFLEIIPVEGMVEFLQPSPGIFLVEIRILKKHGLDVLEVPRPAGDDLSIKLNLRVRLAGQ
jgi:hypothetical protein